VKLAQPQFFRSELPVMHKIEIALRGAGGDYNYVQSPKIARSVYISFGDLDVESSDNYFDKFPGEPAAVTLRSSAKID